LCPQLYLFTAVLKGCLALSSIFLIFSLHEYYSGVLRLMRIRRDLISGKTGVLTSPLAIFFLFECFLCSLQIPPGAETTIHPEWQLVSIIRLYQVIKLLKEHNELRYNRLTNVLSSLAKIRFTDTFLIKTHFLKHPAQVLLAIYMFCVFGLGYVVFVFERSDTKYLDVIQLQNIVWLVVVSITNLGFGDIYPKSSGGRVFVASASIIGTLITALMIGVMTEWLDIPINEKRILTAIKRQRFHRDKRDAAARVIQCAWKYYRFRQRKLFGDLSSLNGRSKMSLRMNFSAAMSRKTCEENFQLSLTKWRSVRQYSSQHLIDKGDVDPVIETTHKLSRKLSEIQVQIDKSNSNISQIPYSVYTTESLRDTSLQDERKLSLPGRRTSSKIPNDSPSSVPSDSSTLHNNEKSVELLYDNTHDEKLHTLEMQMKEILNLLKSERSRSATCVNCNKCSCETNK